ncbi:MAG: hypothetical protein DRI89_03235 [Bacteroidetes bacterium]|nr:MAG: hypothetical protein DRI89_03235 [Bacteroidota bacterium]
MNVCRGNKGDKGNKEKKGCEGNKVYKGANGHKGDWAIIMDEFIISPEYPHCLTALYQLFEQLDCL